ncbi:MAG: hypothetical protein ACXWIA_12595, partial [Candidatus Aminicenantales bacterium]
MQAGVIRGTASGFACVAPDPVPSTGTPSVFPGLLHPWRRFVPGIGGYLFVARSMKAATASWSFTRLSSCRYIMCP